MDTVLKNPIENRKVMQRSWQSALVSLLPVWLLSVAVMAEGFPRSPVPIWLAVAAFISSMICSIVLLWKHWMGVELVLFSLIPFVLMVKFDEISTAYKNPLIILCACILSGGVLGFQRSRVRLAGLVLLLVAAGVTLIVASSGASGYWDLVSRAGFGDCYPECLPTLDQYPWWSILISR